MLRVLVLLLPVLLATASPQPMDCVFDDQQACISEDAILLQARGNKGKPSVHVSTGKIDKFPLATFAGTSMYFVLVDRFARDDGNLTACANNEAQNNVWCGGTLKGITRHLDYIAELGFDCIWLTPVIKQYPGRTPSGTGAMGYWAQDIYSIDENYGTAYDYHELIDTAHEKGLCIVQDFVANHMGPIHSTADVEPMNPFNKPEHFHQLFRGNMTFDQYTHKSGAWPPPAQAMWSQSGAQCSTGMSCMCYKDGANGTKVWDPDGPCPKGMLSDFCKPGDYACKGYNETITQEGWFYDLGDLNQTNPFVRAEMLKWIEWYADTYKIDAFRLDTAPFMDFDFLSELQEAARIPIIGEVTSTNLTYHAQFEANPPPNGRPVLDGVLNFPTFFSALSAFCPANWFPFSQGNLTFLGERMMAQIESGLYKSVDTLGNFVDNHDVHRATKACGEDRSRTTNFVAWSMLTKGVPIVYYGTEEFLTWEREAFWTYGYNTSTQMFKFLKSVNGLRKEKELAVSEMQVQTGFGDWQLVFTRGGSDPVWVYLNNLEETVDRIKYCGISPPSPRKGFAWSNAVGHDVVFFTDHTCFWAADSYPVVLVQKPVPP